MKKIKIIIWKLRYSFYMWRVSGMPIRTCYAFAGAGIENNPDDMWEDGPIYYAQEEMACWYD